MIPISARPFAYNTGSPVQGTDQVGDLAVEIPTYGFSSTGLQWWNGPNESLGYVIAHPVPAGNQPTQIPGVTASLGFNRTPDLTDGSFIALAEYVANKYSTPQTFGSASSASIWLTANGFWNSYPAAAATLIMNLDSTLNVSGSNWYDNTGYNNHASLTGGYGTTTYNGNQVITLNGTNGYVYPTSGFGSSLDTGFTYEVWVYPTKSSNGTIIGEWGGVVPNGWTDAQIAFVGGRINSGVYPSSSFSGTGYILGPSFSQNNWYNIVMTYDGYTLTQYVNGTSQGSVGGTKANPGGNTHLTLGRPDGANTYLGGASGWFQGYIGSWKVWNGAIGASDVSNNYNSNKSKYGL